MKELVSDIKIMTIKPQKGIVAFASFIIANAVHLSSVAICTRTEGGYRLSYPFNKGGHGHRTLFFPINKEVGKHIEDEVIREYEDKTAFYFS